MQCWIFGTDYKCNRDSGNRSSSGLQTFRKDSWLDGIRGGLGLEGQVTYGLVEKKKREASSRTSLY